MFGRKLPENELILAVREGDLTTVKDLIKRGANIFDTEEVRKDGSYEFVEYKTFSSIQEIIDMEKNTDFLPQSLESTSYLVGRGGLVIDTERTITTNAYKEAKRRWYNIYRRKGSPSAPRIYYEPTNVSIKVWEKIANNKDWLDLDTTSNDYRMDGEIQYANEREGLDVQLKHLNKTNLTREEKKELKLVKEKMEARKKEKNAADILKLMLDLYMIFFYYKQSKYYGKNTVITKWKELLNTDEIPDWINIKLQYIDMYRVVPSRFAYEEPVAHSVVVPPGDMEGKVVFPEDMEAEDKEKQYNQELPVAINVSSQVYGGGRRRRRTRRFKKKRSRVKRSRVKRSKRSKGRVKRSRGRKRR